MHLKLVNTKTMLGGNRETHTKPKLGKFVYGVLKVRLINLINQKQDGFACGPKHPPNHLVESREPIATIRDEEDEIGGGNCKVCLLLGGRLDDFRCHFAGQAYTAGIEEGVLVQFLGNDIPRDTGLVMHNGDAFAGKPIEKAALANIWSANKGHGTILIHWRKE